MKAVVSIPYSRIGASAAEDGSGLFTGQGFFGSSKVVLTASRGEFEFELRGPDEAHIAHDIVLIRML